MGGFGGWGGVGQVRRQVTRGRGVDWFRTHAASAPIPEGMSGQMAFWLLLPCHSSTRRMPTNCPFAAYPALAHWTVACCCACAVQHQRARCCSSLEAQVRAYACVCGGEKAESIITKHAAHVIQAAVTCCTFPNPAHHLSPKSGETELNTLLKVSLYHWSSLGMVTCGRSQGPGRVPSRPLVRAVALLHASHPHDS